MLQVNADTSGYCIKCDSETKYLIPAFDNELRLIPVCWRCFWRADHHINLRPDWRRMGRDSFTTQAFHPVDNKSIIPNMFLVQGRDIGKTRTNREAPPRTQPSVFSSELKRAA